MGEGPATLAPGTSLPGLRSILARATTSRSRLMRSSRGRLSRIRRCVASANLNTLVQFALAIYLLVFLHVCINKAIRQEAGDAAAASAAAGGGVVATGRNASSRSMHASLPGKRLRPPTIVGFSVQGGVGNQIYNILEMLYVTRQVGGVMLMPAVLPRADTGEGDGGDGDVRPGSSVWDMEELSKGARGRRVHAHLPPACRGRIDLLYTVLRRNNAPPDNDSVPSEVRWGACALLTVASHPSGTPDCDVLFEHTQPFVRRQNLTTGGDPSFIDEMRSLQRLSSAHKAPDEPLCVWIHGHPYDRGGVEGDEYLYSHMHFLSSVPRIRAAARRWPLANLALVHVRYDEELCDARSHGEGHVCVRAHKDGKRKDPVYWAPLHQFVTAITEAARESGVGAVYLAASPYVPAKTVRAIRAGLAQNLKVVLPASAVFDDETDINFLERELAIEAKMFIGEFASTWSGTVHYKRRTLARVSHWSNVLLGVAGNIGYYDRTSPLTAPE